MISNFVACKACKKVYAFKPKDGTQSLRKHNCSENRGLRVYPTRPLVGLLRVTGIPAGRVGSGRVVKTVYPYHGTLYIKLSISAYYIGFHGWSHQFYRYRYSGCSCRAGLEPDAVVKLFTQ